MKMDPYTLVLVLGPDGKAEGELYVDDGKSFDYEHGAYIHRKFIYENGALRSEDLGTKGKLTDKYAKKMEKVRIERVLIVGAPSEWKGKKKVVVSEEGEKESKGGKKVEIKYFDATGGKAAYAVVRDPKVAVGKGWKIDFSS